MMEWKLDHSAGPRGYLVGTITITIPVEGVARLALDRPDKLNAFNSAMIGEIRAPVWRLNYDDSVRVIMLTGEGLASAPGAT
ncbi:enoyl-CoA hydratase-related protein [Caballeronia sp. INDeC2]|uniref:enoyl-CoA hydratase-related protein n=1 Tax=Caballeronia sp. INDeC2 TaxID=2921747 RepID=UPI002027A036|nr:enoyl-CoA hydratase-related protein [Caballeronia sp. INDeC2]